MAVRLPMGAPRVLVIVVFALTAASQAANSAPVGSGEGKSADSSQPPFFDSATETAQEKINPDSSSNPHRRSREKDAPPAELAQAEDLIQKHDYGAAEPLLRKIVESDPTNYVAWFDLGFTENGLGKLDESIAAYRRSVAAKPDVFESNLNLGLQLAKTGQADSEKFLRAATQLKPTSHVDEGRARAWLSLASVLESSQPEQALAAYREVSSLQPKDPEPHLAAGRLLEQAHNLADAEQEYKQALALDASSDALTALANLYMEGRRFPEAEEYLRKLLAAHPDQAAAHAQLGRVLAAQGKNDAGIAELQAGAKLAPGDISVQRDLADLYATAGKNDQAESTYRALVTAQPQDAQLHRDLGQALLREKKFVNAQQEFIAAIKLKPELCEAYGDLAFAANENKDYPLTIKALDTRAKCMPEIPITYFLRASAFDHLRNYKQAVVNYHLFINTAAGKYPDQEWQAKHRLIAIEPKK